MARRIQIFTRLEPRQEVTLQEIGQEMADQGITDVIRHDGEINVSEVIRILLGRADRRLR